MLRRLTGTIVVGLGWLACVGDDPVAGPGTDATTGERLGPCFADGKCKEGLACHPTEKVCIAADATPADASTGVDAETDASGTETGAGDAAPLRCELAPSRGLPCPNSPCTGLDTCCVDETTGNRQCSTSCNARTRIECDSQFCGAGTRCCAGVETEVFGSVCKTRVTVSFVQCLSTCPGSAREPCRTNTECPPGKSCLLSEVQLAPGSVAVWGFCS